jgi:hypothetical protein
MDFLLQHHNISEIQEILMVTLLLQDSLVTIIIAAATGGPATPTGLQNTLVTQKYLQGGMQQQEQRGACLVSSH